MTVDEVKQPASSKQAEFRAAKTPSPVSHAALLSQPTLSPINVNATSNITISQLDAAKALIKEARDAQNKYNEYRMANPRRNDNGAGSAPSSQKLKKRDDSIPIPVLNSTVKEALVLVGELDAQAKAANGKCNQFYNIRAYF